MGTFKSRWIKLTESKVYRAAFVAAQVKQAIPYQIRALLKAQGLSQQELAERSELTQGAVSRAANPRYGNLSVNTCVRLAAGFDVAFVGKFVPFSELDRWLDYLHNEAIVPTFETENKYADLLFDKFDIPEQNDWLAGANETKRQSSIHLLDAAPGQLGFGSNHTANSLRGGADIYPRLVFDNPKKQDSPLAEFLNEHQPVTDRSELQTASY